jgi:PilZ domain
MNSGLMPSITFVPIMTAPLTQPRTPPQAEERRRHQRVKVNLLGRYMLADRREYPCQVVNMSPGGIALVAPVLGNPGDRVIAYVDHLGRLEGKIARIIDNGFAMTVEATLRKRDKLAAQLTWLANQQLLNLPEDRRHGRFIPKKTMARLVLPNGNNVACRIIDVSESGAAIAISAVLRPTIGTMVTIGKTLGRVVRHIDDGFAIEFTRLQHPDFVEDNLTGD